MSEAPRAGELAPEFELPDSKGEKHTLTGLLAEGKVVLVFFRGMW